MSTDTYNTIKQASEGIYKEKGSKFITYAYPVTSEKEIKEHIAFAMPICLGPIN